MKAGGSAGHGLVLSCQGAECRPWAHSRGKSRVEGGGRPQDEGRGERGSLTLEEFMMKRQMEDHGSLCTFQSLCSSSTGLCLLLIPQILWAAWTEAAPWEQCVCVCVCVRVYLFSMVKIEVYLGSSNSLWSAEGCHWKEFTDCSHENWIKKLIYWAKMFRNNMPVLFHFNKKITCENEHELNNEIISK